MHPDKMFSFGEGDWLDGTPYRVVRPIGSGGMGEVYEVDHTRTGTRRAVKVCRHFTAQSIMPRRLLREARTLQSIDHPHVVRVYEVGTLSDRRPYFSMELLEGTSLRSIIVDRAPLELGMAIGLMLQILDGLAAIHACGFVHRDIKPSNVFVDSHGVAKVIDLGIVKPMSPLASGPRTREGVVVGTTRYMAPEQLVGGVVDGRADVYSAGLVFLEMLVGRQRIDAAWKDGSQIEFPRGLPAVCKDIVRCALARDASRRFGSAEDMAAAIRSSFYPCSQSHLSNGKIVPAESITLPETKSVFCCPQSVETLGVTHTPRRVQFPTQQRLGALAVGVVLAIVAATVAWTIANSSVFEPRQCGTHVG